MATFDFGALLQNPAFQFGTTLLGSARQPNSIGNAFKSIQQLQEYKQQQDFQKAQIENMRQQREAENQRAIIAQGQLDRQNAIADRQAATEERKQQMQDAFMKQLQGLGIFGNGGNQTAPQAQPQAAPPQGAITPQLMNGLAQVESSGNPFAVNPESGAEGLYQFMPATTRMIRQRNPSFDPFNAKMARTEAEKLLGNMTQRNGGDLLRGLASYGGFKKKDPTAYQRSVFQKAGMEFPGDQQASANAPGSPIPVGGGMANQGLDIARLGVGAGVAGVPGAAQIMELAKIMAPQNVPAGGYQRTADGNMQYIPDPMATARLAQEAQKIGLEEKRTNATVAEKDLKATTAKESDLSGYQDVASSMDRLLETTDKLLTHPGLPSTTGLSGVGKIYNLTQSGRDAMALKDNVKNKLVIDTLLKMKALSKNGSSGFGQLSEKEGTRLETYISNLSNAQSLEQTKSALQDIRTFANSTKSALGNRLRKIYGDEVSAAPPTETAPSTEEGVLSLDQYIKKHKKP